MTVRGLISPPRSFSGSPNPNSGFFKPSSRPNPNPKEQRRKPTFSSDAVRAKRASPPRITTFRLPTAVPNPNHLQNQNKLDNNNNNTTPKSKAAIANANSYANLIHPKYLDSDPNSNPPRFKHLPSHGSGQQQVMKNQSPLAHPQLNNQLQHLSTHRDAGPEIPIYIGEIPIYIGKDPKNIPANSIYESIGSDTKKECSSQGNALRIFQIYKDIVSHRQGNSSITSYFTKLKTLWDEFETYSDLPKCYSSDATKKLSEHLEREKVMQFLLGLNDSYSTISSQILLIRPFPTMEKAYSLIIGRISALSTLEIE